MNGFAMYGFILGIFALVFWRRTRAMIRPIQGSGIKILLPILYMLPGVYAFTSLPLHVKPWEIGIASLIGLILAIPLIVTTNYEIRQDVQIYAQKNISFFIALIAVLVIRIVLRQFISGLDATSLAMLFFTVAFSYVVPWRIASYLKFRKVKQSQESGKEVLPIKA